MILFKLKRKTIKLVQKPIDELRAHQLSYGPEWKFHEAQILKPFETYIFLKKSTIFYSLKNGIINSYHE